MKVLIVDDEKHVREGIRLLANWEENNIKEIYEASNGEDAIELIERYKPELIFSDMKMPKMDGTQLLEWIKKNQPTSKTIVITGYDDYDYMRKAIHFNSFDYLLKPVDPEILNNALKNAVERWNEEELDRKKKVNSDQLINKMKPAYRDRKLTHFLTSRSVNEEVFREFQFYLASEYRVAVMCIMEKTIEQFNRDRELAYFSILNIIAEALNDRRSGIAFRYLANKGEIAIILWNKQEDVDKLLTEIYKKIQRTFDVSCPIAVGGPVGELAKLMDSYEAGKELLYSMNVLEKRTIRVYSGSMLPKLERKSLMKHNAAIKMAMETGEIGAFHDLLEQVAAEYTEDGILTWRQLLYFEKEYRVIGERWYKNYQIALPEAWDSAENRTDGFFDPDGSFQLEAYKSYIKKEITVFLKKVKRASASKENSIIYEIEKYVVANFNRDVKLQELSERFYISREYISRRFKKEFQVTITDYLTKIRVEKAKSLLVNSSLKIYEIANLIGYQDDKYFRKLFKKTVGVTPNEYRDKQITNASR